MKTYKVEIHAPAIIKESYIVEANNMSQAKSKALSLFDDDHDNLRRGARLDIYFDEKEVKLVEKY